MRTMVETGRTTTAEQLLQMPRGGWRYELVCGELRRMSPAGSVHGVIASTLGASLREYVQKHRRGLVFAAETGFLLASKPDTVRAPDAAFVAAERIPESGIPEGYWSGAPDLAAEVVSLSDRFTEVHEKVLEWLDAGCRMVLVVEPERRTVTIFRSRDQSRILTAEDVIDGDDVLPGWTLPVRALFDFRAKLPTPAHQPHRAQ